MTQVLETGGIVFLCWILISILFAWCWATNMDLTIKGLILLTPVILVTLIYFGVTAVVSWL